MDLTQAPALVGMTPKSWWLSPAQTKALLMAVRAVQGVPIEVPLSLDGRPLGMIGSDWTREIYFSPFTGIDDIVTKCLNGQRYGKFWMKNFGAWSNPVLTSRWLDLWNVIGDPMAGTYTGTANTARQLDNTVVGGLAHGAAVSPSVKCILNGLTYQFSTSTLLSSVTYAYDRVLAYESTTLPLSQTFTNTLAAQRYNGAGLPGMLIMAVAQDAISSSGSLGLSGLTYVNQAGTTQSAPVNANDYTVEGHSQLIDGNTPAEMVFTDAVSTNGHPFLPLVAGDSGARSITSYTMSAAATGGTAAFVLVRPLALMATTVSAVPTKFDYIRQIPIMPTVYDGAHITFMTWFDANGVARSIYGNLDFAWG